MDMHHLLLKKLIFYYFFNIVRLFIMHRLRGCYPKSGAKVRLLKSAGRTFMSPFSKIFHYSPYMSDRSVKNSGNNLV